MYPNEHDHDPAKTNPDSSADSQPAKAEPTPPQSVAHRTAAILSKYRRIPPPTPAEERAAFEEAVAKEVAESREE